MALLGQNGAGKSTLIQIVAGCIPPGSYEGEMTFDGRPFRPAGVAEAEAAGVALVPQEVNVVPDLSVAENIFLNDEPTPLGSDRRRRADRAARARPWPTSALDVDPAAPMGALDLATQQLVVIARALAQARRGCSSSTSRPRR